MHASNIVRILFCLAIFILPGCGKNSDVISPSSGDAGGVQSSCTGPTLLAAVDFTFDPISREGEAIVRSRDLALDNIELYHPAVPIQGITVDAGFVELDNLFNFVQGEIPLPEAYEMLTEANPSDAVFVYISIDNQSLAQVTIYEPMAVLEFDDPPLWPVADDPDKYQFPKPYLCNGDGFLGYPEQGEACFQISPRFASCYGPYKFFRTDSISDPELPPQSSEEEVLMIAIPDGAYEPVSWTTYVIGYTATPPDDTAPVEIITPYEDPDLALEVETGEPYTFSVRLRIPPSSEPPTENDLEIALDLTQLRANEGVPYLEYLVPLEAPGDPLVWHTEVPLILSEAQGFKSNLNKVYLVPVIARQLDGQGSILPFQNLSIPNQADFFVLPRQSGVTSGYHMVSYLAEDPITHNPDIFLHNTFTDERLNLSNDPAVENFHTISNDGSRVAWGNNDGEVWLWDKETGGVSLFNPETIRTAFINDGADISSVDVLTLPVISPDNARVAMQVNWTKTGGGAQFSIIIADVSTHLPNDLDSSDFLVIRNTDDFEMLPSYPVTITSPWISDLIKFYIPSGSPQINDGYMLSFPYSFPDFSPLNPSEGRIAVCLVKIHNGGSSEIMRGLTQEVLNGNGSIDPGFEDNAVRHPGYSRYFMRNSVVMRPNTDINVRNTGMLTYEAEEQGNFMAYRVQINFNADGILDGNSYFLLGYDQDWQLRRGDEVRFIGGNRSSREMNQFLPMSALEADQVGSEGAFTTVRDGLEREAKILIDFEYLDNPQPGEYSRGHFSLSNITGLSGANCDVPAVSQGTFSLLGGIAPFPAVAFDSELTSTSDIYYARWTGFFNNNPALPTLAVKRLTYDGTGRFPRVSGWID